MAEIIIRFDALLSAYFNEYGTDLAQELTGVTETEAELVAAEAETHGWSDESSGLDAPSEEEE